MRTFIRRPGNKSKYLKHILPLFPKSYNTYIEPFVGSGAVFLNIRPTKWIINDINKDIINIWKSVQHDPSNLINLFEIFSKHFKPLNIKQKKLYCQLLTDQISSINYNYDRASLYLLMSYVAYIGHIMRNGKFYFPGLDKNLNYENLFFLSESYKKNLFNISNYLKTSNGMILNQDYKQILKKAKSGDFVFLDPPYVENHNYQLNYSINENITEDFISSLLLELKKLDSKNIKWMMTQADTKFIRKLFKDYYVSEFTVFRGYTNSYKNELIIRNYDTVLPV